MGVSLRVCAAWGSNAKAFLAAAALLFTTAHADEIIVTGERRPQDLRSVASSASAIGGEELALIGADHASEILARAPGVLVHRGSGQEHLTAIRSPVLTGGAGAGSFLFLEDGVPLRSAGFANVNALFEAHTEIAGRVEVIRGPSGALYGANAIHGVVNVLTPEPGEATDGYLSVSGDTVDRFKGSASLSGATGPHGFFGGLSLLSEGGYRAATGLDQQKATLRHGYEGEGIAVSTIFAAVNLNQETGGFVIGPDAYRDDALRRANANPEAFRDSKAFRLMSRIDIEAGEGVDVAVTPYARWTAQEFLLHFFPSKALEENGHWSVGAQGAVYADIGGVDLIAGLDWEYTEGYLSEVQSIPTIGTFTQGVHYDYAVTALGASPFVQASFDLGARLRLALAVRADWTRYDYDNRASDGASGRFLRPPDGRDGFLTASPKASLLYDVAGGALRASYARGSRPPQTADLYRLQTTQVGDGADPETIDAVEVGWRGALGSRVDLDVAAYFMAKRNFFFRDADGFNVDDGRTRHLGFEADLSARPTDEVAIEINASYGRHSYRFDRPVASLPQATEAIRSGDDVDTAPRWLAGARARWSPARAPVSAEIEWLFIDRYFTDAANTKAYPGHTLVNLRADLRVSDHLRLTATVRNLLDERYAERADFAFGEERYFPGEARTVSVGLRASL